MFSCCRVSKSSFFFVRSCFDAEKFTTRVYTFWH